jgi:hypothetical protein
MRVLNLALDLCESASWIVKNKIQHWDFRITCQKFYYSSSPYWWKWYHLRKVQGMKKFQFVLCRWVWARAMNEREKWKFLLLNSTHEEARHNQNQLTHLIVVIMQQRSRSHLTSIHPHSYAKLWSEFKN